MNQHNSLLNRDAAGILASEDTIDVGWRYFRGWTEFS